MSFLRHAGIYRSDVILKTWGGVPPPDGRPPAPVQGRDGRNYAPCSSSAMSSRAGYSLAGCSPVWGHIIHGQNAEGTERNNRAPGPRVIRPSMQWCSFRARSSSVAPGCVIKTVVTRVRRKASEAIPIGRVPDFTTWPGPRQIHLLGKTCHANEPVKIRRSLCLF